MSVGGGVMAVWSDLEPGREAEFDAWYRRQHLPERLSQPGFCEARRYFAEQGSPRYCAFYWLDNVAALNTPQYLERLAQPTRWTQRIMPWFRNMARSPCTVTLDRGCGLGGTMIWIAASGRTGIAHAPRSTLRPVFDACCDDAEIARMQLWECDASVLRRDNPEARLRNAPDRVADWIVFIEGSSEAAVSRSARLVQVAIGEDETDAALLASPCYRLTWQVSAAEVPAPCSDEEAGVTWSA